MKTIKACNTSMNLTPVPGSMCLKFYFCINSQINIISCPAGLLFDTNLKKCNYAINVVCTELTTTKSITTTQGK